MAAEEKTNSTDKTARKEIYLGDNFGAAVIHVNGLTLNTDGQGNVKLQNGNVTIDITDGNISVYKGSEDATVQLKQPTNDPDVLHSSLDKRAIQVGDVLGQDFDLPEGLERLNGWLIYNITEEGVPQALEPKESAPEGVVSWKTGINHAEKTLKKQGHENARLWTEADGTAIFNNVVKGGHNDKAQLDVSRSHPYGIYWEGTEGRYNPDSAAVRYPDGGDRDWLSKVSGARVRGVQDVPELAP